MISQRDGLAGSVQVRLAWHAKTIDVESKLVLTRYAVEQFFDRFSR